MAVSIVRAGLKIIPLALIAVGVAVSAYWIGLVHAQRDALRNPPANASAPAPNSAPDNATLQKQTADLSSQIDALTKAKEAFKDRLDSAEWVLSIVMAAIALLTVAQGLFAFFSAQNYVSQADQAIDRAGKAVTTAEAAEKDVIRRFEELAARIQSRFPMLADTESARAEAFAKLSKLISPLTNADENLYAKSDSLTRQEVFAIESFSAVQFLTAADRGNELVANLRLLGRFYAGKFLSDGQVFQPDFDRSHYYFVLAEQKSHRSYFVLNDLGWLFTSVAKPPDWDKGSALFEESLRSKPDQQRALYNLGSNWERGKQATVKQAREYLLKAKRQPNWETAPNPAMASHIDYNLACVCDAMANMETDPVLKSNLLDECCDYLDQAAAPGTQQRDLLDGDLRAGDLVTLAGSQPHAHRLRGIRAKYRPSSGGTH
jgi:chaperonin cofactor prefoldin